MTHAAKDDDEQDTSEDDNANGMKNQWFDGVFCENVLQILGITLPEPRFRSSADQFGLVGTMESASLKARKKKRLKIAHETLSEPRSPATRSPGPPLPPADLKN